MRRLALRGALAAAAFVGVGLVVGCQPEIGDACEVSTDCSIRGERVCDLSNLVGGEGECIIEGCTRASCPEEAACIVVYSTEFASIPCDPAREDVATFGEGEGCVDGVCPARDDCTTSQICLLEGVCVDRLAGRTSCRRACDSDGDCRSGYSCERTGVRGVYAAPDPDDPNSSETTKICVPER